MAALWNRAGHYIFIMWFLLFISSSFFLASVGPLAADAENGLPVWGTPSKFQWGSGFGFVTAPTSLSRDQPNLSRCLAVSWAGKLYRHFRGLLLPNGILPGALFTFRPSLAFSYICSVTARHSSSGREPNFAAFSRGRHLYSAGRPSRWASAHILVMAALRSRCGHYIFVLWFLLYGSPYLWSSNKLILSSEKFERVQDIIKFEKVRDPHVITTVIGRHSVFLIL